MTERLLRQDSMMSAVFDLTGRVAIVTGASGALGRRFAEVLGAAGAAIVLAARRTDRLAAIAQRLPRAIAVECDVTVPGRVDILHGGRRWPSTGGGLPDRRSGTSGDLAWRGSHGLIFARASTVDRVRMAAL